MSQKAQRNIKKSITNAFGSFGYLFCFLQWFWAIILYLGPIQSLVSFISSSNNKQAEQPSGLTLTLPDPLGAIILGAIVVVMASITVYVLISMPKRIVKTSNKIVHKTAETLVPLVIKVQHKQDTKRFHIMMTTKLVFAIKVLLVIIPITPTAASGLLEQQSLDYSIVITIGYGLACFSVMFFAVQYILAKLLHVKISDLW